MPDAQVANLPVLAQAQVAEVRRARIDLRRGPRGPELLEQRVLAVPLLVERDGVLALAAGEDLLAQALELLDQRVFGRTAVLGQLAEQARDPLEQREFLGDDRRSPAQLSPPTETNESSQGTPSRREKTKIFSTAGAYSM